MGHAMRRSILFVLFWIVSACVATAYADPIAKVIAVQGAPSASGPGGNRTLEANGAIFESDKITVGSGNAQILFIDGTKLVVGPGSTLVVEKFLMRGGNSAQNFSINALRGTFRFITGNSPKSAYKIKTANATIGIRGTGFDFWVQKNTGVAVLAGKVRLCDKTNKTSCVNINAGCELGVTDLSSSKLVKGDLKSSAIVRKLPYIISQRSLNTRFKLNTSACQRFVSYDPTSNQGSSKTNANVCRGNYCN